MWAVIDPGENDRLELLRDSLRYRSDQDALAALRAMALLGDRNEIGAAVESLTDPNPSQRANALEVIDSVAEPDLVRPLLRMWEHGTRSSGEGSSAVEALRNDPDAWIRACAEFTMTTRGGTMETLTTLSPMERVLFLRKVPLFEDLPPPDLLPIASVAREVSFGEGDSIAQEGEVGDEMHIIVSGDVSVVASDDGGPRILATRSTGDVVGEMSLLTNAPRMAELVARSPVHALSLDRGGFESILRERPETALGVIRVLCRRLAEAGGPAQEDVSGTTDTTAST